MGRYATGGNLSEAVVLNVAEQLVKTGLRDAGYVFVRSPSDHCMQLPIASNLRL